MKKIQLKELHQLFDLIIKKLENEGLNELSFKDDYYNIIPTSKWNIYEENTRIDVGSLVDDIDSLKLLIDQPERPCTYVDFDRVASVLRAISQINNPEETL